MKKTKKDLEKEAEEKKRLEEEKSVFFTVAQKTENANTRAQALVMAEYEEAFERPQFDARGGVRGSGFVRAGGEY
jgi:U2-associated protein SR140